MMLSGAGGRRTGGFGHTPQRPAGGDLHAPHKLRRCSPQDRSRQPPRSRRELFRGRRQVSTELRTRQALSPRMAASATALPGCCAGSQADAPSSATCVSLPSADAAASGRRRRRSTAGRNNTGATAHGAEVATRSLAGPHALLQCGAAARCNVACGSGVGMPASTLLMETQVRRGAVPRDRYVLRSLEGASETDECHAATRQQPGTWPLLSARANPRVLAAIGPSWLGDASAATRRLLERTKAVHSSTGGPSQCSNALLARSSALPGWLHATTPRGHLQPACERMSLPSSAT